MDLNACYYITGGLVFFIIIMTIVFIRHTSAQDKEIDSLRTKLSKATEDLVAAEYRKEYVEIQLEKITKVIKDEKL